MRDGLENLTWIYQESRKTEKNLRGKARDFLFFSYQSVSCVGSFYIAARRLRAALVPLAIHVCLSGCADFWLAPPSSLSAQLSTSPRHCRFHPSTKYAFCLQTSYTSASAPFFISRLRSFLTLPTSPRHCRFHSHITDPARGILCSPATPCASGSGDCDTNADCQGAFVCVPSSDGLLSGGGMDDFCGTSANAAAASA